MALIFRTATLSEGQEVARIIRAAFTPYVRALGREFPADGSPEFAERWQRLLAELERGDVYVALKGNGERNGEGNGVARARGLGGLSLMTAEMAVANIRLYERHGFAIVRRGVLDHGIDAHPRVYMAKTFQLIPS